MAFTPKLTYKGKPLVRKDNELYYGNMTDPYVLYLQITTTKPVGDQQVADKVHLMLLSTDTTKAPQERVMRQTTKIGLYNALDIGSIWLHPAATVSWSAVQLTGRQTAPSIASAETAPGVSTMTSMPVRSERNMAALSPSAFSRRA